MFDLNGLGVRTRLISDSSWLGNGGAPRLALMFFVVVQLNHQTRSKRAFRLSLFSLPPLSLSLTESQELDTLCSIGARTTRTAPNGPNPLHIHVCPSSLIKPKPQLSQVFKGRPQEAPIVKVIFSVAHIFCFISFFACMDLFG